MRIFKTAAFQKFATREDLSDVALRDAVDRAEAGSIDAKLGAGLIKQRVARPSAGRSGGYRTIVLFRAETRSVFVFGFAKNRQASLDKQETAVFRKAAKIVLGLEEDAMEAEVVSGRMIEIG